jgi:hypothetical protein
MDNYILNGYRTVFRSKTYDLTDSEELDGIQIFESSGLIGASLNQDPNLIASVPASGDHIRIYGASPDYFNGVFEIDSIGTTPDSVIYFSNSVGASTGETTTGPYKLELLKNFDVSGANVLGSVVTFLADSEGNGIASATRSLIENDLDGKVVAGLTYKTTNALVADFDVNITIVIANGFSALDVRSAVDVSISAYLSPQEWDWSPTIRRNAIITRISQVPGVSYIDDLTLTVAADQYLCYLDVEGDIRFNYKGVLPRANITVGSV